jgi:hypothetical protein
MAVDGVEASLSERQRRVGSGWLIGKSHAANRVAEFRRVE